MSRWDPYLSLLATVVIAYGLDRWVQSLREASLQTFEFRPHLWGALIANLLLGAMLLGLAWLASIRKPHSRWMAAVFTLVGSSLTLLPLLLTSVPASLFLLQSKEFRILRVTLLYSGPNSRLLYTAAFVTALGVTGLLPVNRDLIRKILGPFW